MLLLLLTWRLLRRFHRPLLSAVLSFQLAWLPVHTARAAVPLAVVGIGILALRVYQVAAAGVGAALTASGLTATQAAAGGIAGAGLLQFADANWADIVQYTQNATASYMTGVSAGTPSFASMASSVGVNTASTDTTSYSWSPLPGAVTANVGNVPIKDALSPDNDAGDFPSIVRWDGYRKYQPIAGTSFSTVWNASGFKAYLCPVLSPSINEPDAACRTLPEMPFATYKYQTQYQSIGAGCIDANTCARAYVAGRLVHLSGSLNTSYQNEQGQSWYQQAIQNVTTNFGSCYDARYSQYNNFGGYRCPVTLSYQQAYLSPGQPVTFNSVTENLVIDVTLIRPSFSTGTSLNDYIDRYPAAGMEPIVPTSLANVFNAMFQAAAAKPGYSGLNYFPITAAHVSAALQPGEYVPLNELVKPISSSGTGTQPGTGTGNPTAPGSTVDLGPNPAIAAPTLEGIPTAAQILAPIFDLFPSLRNFTVPGHTSQCPQFVVPFFGQDIATTKHCELIEGQRSAIGAAALVGWSIAALVIVLGA
jgi:hypothetical protein